MKTSAKLITTVSIALLLLIPTGSALAFWGSPIHPGDHVIDLKRLEDSTKVYTQKIQEYMNQAQKYIDMAIMNSGVLGLDKRVASAIDRYSTKYLGTTIVNPAISSETAKANAQNLAQEDAKNLTEFRAQMREESMSANADALATFQQNMSNIAGRTTAISDILNEKTGKQDTGGSIVGETQKTNAISTVRAQNSISGAESEGASLARQIEADNARLVEENAQRADGPLARFPSYDPYHPNSTEEATMKENSENFGFGHFTGGEP